MPFTPESVDALLRSCLEYRADHGPYFCVGEIAGGQHLPPDIDQVKELMDWVVETDNKLLAFAGYNKDNVACYRLGRDAEAMMNSGGFKAYMTRKKRIAALSHASVWLTVVASIAAVVVAVLAWRAPKNDEQAFDKISERLGSLETQLRAQKSTDDRLATAIEDVRKQVKAVAQRVQAKPAEKKR